MDDQERRWFPLTGAKSGQILLMSDFVDNSRMLVRKVGFNIIRTNDLIKTNLVEKSDPYAVMKHSNQKNKIPVVKNCRNTEGNHELDFEVPDGKERTLSVENGVPDKMGPDSSCKKIVYQLAPHKGIPKNLAQF